MSSATTNPESDLVPGSGTSCDSFLDGRFRALQPESGPRAAIDALFLAAAVPAGGGGNEQVLEAGLGTGVTSLAFAVRVPGVRITGVEIQPELCDLARENVRLNKLSSRITVTEADLTGPRQALLDAGLKPESFAHVFANPPYYSNEKSRASGKEPVARAYSGDAGTLEAWVRFLASMASPKGTVTLIHRANALGEVLDALRPRFGRLTVSPLFPHEGDPARRIIVQGVKGSRAPLVIAPGLVLHEAGGEYTQEAEKILRHGEKLDIARLPSPRVRRE